MLSVLFVCQFETAKIHQRINGVSVFESLFFFIRSVHKAFTHNFKYSLTYIPMCHVGSEFQQNKNHLLHHIFSSFLSFVRCIIIAYSKEYQEQTSSVKESEIYLSKNSSANRAEEFGLRNKICHAVQFKESKKKKSASHTTSLPLNETRERKKERKSKTENVLSCWWNHTIFILQNALSGGIKRYNIKPFVHTFRLLCPPVNTLNTTFIRTYTAQDAAKCNIHNDNIYIILNVFVPLKSQIAHARLCLFCYCFCFIPRFTIITTLTSNNSHSNKNSMIPWTVCVCFDSIRILRLCIMDV